MKNFFIHHRLSCARLFLLVLILLPASVSFAESREDLIPKLMVFDVQSLPGQADQARALSQALRIRLYNARVYSLVEGSMVNRLLVSNEVLPGNELSPERIASMARSVDAEYGLYSTLWMDGKKFVLGIQLIFSATGKVLLSRDYQIDEDTSAQTEDKVVKDITESFLTTERTSLTDIRSLASSGQSRDALNLMESWIALHGETEETRMLSRAIKEDIANKAMADAQSLAQKFLFDDALIKINEAITMVPGDPRFTTWIDMIRAKQGEFKATKNSEAIKAMEDLLADEQFESAGLLLQALQKQGILGNEAIGLQSRIDRGLFERREYDQARSEFWARHYDSALTHINEAIRISPAKTEYGELRLKILAYQAKDRSNKADWDAYRKSMEALNPDVLFFDQRVSHQDQGPALGIGSRIWNDPQHPMDMLSLPVESLEFRVRYPFRLPWQTSLDFMELRWFLDFGAQIDGGSAGDFRLVNGLKNYNLFDQSSTFSAMLLPAIGIEMDLFSFGIGFQAGPTLGMMTWDLMNRDISANQDSHTTQAFFNLGAFIEPSLYWQIDKDIRLGLSWQYQWHLLLAPTPSNAMEQLKTSRFQITLGLPLW